MILKTERLLLRPWRDGDANEIFRYASDPLVGPAAESHETIRGVLALTRLCSREPGSPLGVLA